MTNPKPKGRVPLSENVGAYLYNLRILKAISRETLAEHLHVSKYTIRNIENNEKPIRPERLKLWLRFLDCSEHYNQILHITRHTKLRRIVYYQLGSDANEHIDRILDAYENNKLSPEDIMILRLVAPSHYESTESQHTPDVKVLDCSIKTNLKKDVQNSKRSSKTPASLKRAQSRP